MQIRSTLHWDLYLRGQSILDDTGNIALKSFVVIYGSVITSQIPLQYLRIDKSFPVCKINPGGSAEPVLKKTILQEQCFGLKVIGYVGLAQMRLTSSRNHYSY